MILPNLEGGIERVVTGVGSTADRWDFAGLPSQLPPGLYRFEALPASRATDAALAFALGHYRFGRYKKGESSEVKLVWPEGADRAYVEAAAEAVALVRDLVNTPANDMGPAELADAARALAARYGAAFSTIEATSECRPIPPDLMPWDRQPPRAALDRFHLGRFRAPEDHAGGQGRVLRHGRAGYQAR